MLFEQRQPLQNCRLPCTLTKRSLSLVARRRSGPERLVKNGRVRICETGNLAIAALIAEQRAIGSGRSTEGGPDEEPGGACSQAGGGGGLGEMTYLEGSERREC